MQLTGVIDTHVLSSRGRCCRHGCQQELVCSDPSKHHSLSKLFWRFVWFIPTIRTSLLSDSFQEDFNARNLLHQKQADDIIPLNSRSRSILRAQLQGNIFSGNLSSGDESRHGARKAIWRPWMPLMITKRYMGGTKGTGGVLNSLF